MKTPGKTDFPLHPAAALLGLSYVLSKLFLKELPITLVFPAALVAFSLATAWTAFNFSHHGTAQSRCALFSRSWPFWLGMVWTRELFENNAIVDLMLISGFITSLSWYAGIRLSPIVFRKTFREPKHPWLQPALLCLVFVVVFTIQPWLKYISFYSYWMDLGFMLHPLWNTIHGRILQYTQLDGTTGISLGDHFSLIFLFIAPVFRIAPGVLTLFLVQSLACGIGGIYLFALFRRNGCPYLQALLFQAAFYAYAPLQFGLINDFHADPLTVPFICGIIYAFERKKFPPLIINFALCLMCKEHIGLVLTPLLLVLAYRRRSWCVRLILLAIAGFAYTFVAQTMLIPLFNAGSETMAIADYYPGGEGGLKNVVITLLSNPLETAGLLARTQNIEQIVWIFGSLLFVPLIAVPEILAVSLMLLKEMLTSFNIHNHHQAYMAPVLFWCVFTVWRRLSPDRRRALSVAICLSCFIFGFLAGESPLSHRFWRTLHVRYLPDSHDRALRAAVDRIPAGASVSADSHIAIHLFDREKLYLFPRPFPGDSTDYVIMDAHHRESGFEIVRITWGNRPREEIIGQFNALREEGAYATVMEHDGVIVLKRNSAP